MNPTKETCKHCRYDENEPWIVTELCRECVRELSENQVFQKLIEKENGKLENEFIRF